MKSIHATLQIFLNYIRKETTEWSVFVLNIILNDLCLKLVIILFISH